MRTVAIIFLTAATISCRDAGTEVPPDGTGGTGSPAVISGVFPDSAAVSDTVLLVGSGLGDAPGASAVSIGGRTSTVVVSWSSTRIVVEVPAGSTTGSVSVTVGGQTSNTLAFRVLPVAEARVSYSGQVVPLFTSNGCAGCHGGTNNLFVTPHGSLMAGTSNHGPVVTPYDGEGSIIVKKLRGTAGFGNRMPQGSGPLNEADIQLLARWIKQGARNN